MSYYCEGCTSKIKEWDRIFEHDGVYYHEECVALYPVRYVVLFNGEFLCEISDDEIENAQDLIDDLEEDDEDE